MAVFVTTQLRPTAHHDGQYADRGHGEHHPLLMYRCRPGRTLFARIGRGHRLIALLMFR
jgi:hypothetical protein